MIIYLILIFVMTYDIAIYNPFLLKYKIIKKKSQSDSFFCF